MATNDLAAALRAAVHGDVVTPEDPSYPAAVFGVEPVAGQAPEMVVIAADAGDVATAVRLGARSGRRVVLQSAGQHDGPISGQTVRPTILVVTRLLARVQIDPVHRTATVGAGSSWSQVQEAAEQFGLAAASGLVPGVGALGHGINGRLRPVARSVGFAADHVLQLEVVTAAGELIRVDVEHQHFESYRRGRPEFGLVTAMTIALIPADQVYAGGLWFAAHDAATVQHHWREMVAGLPTNVETSLARIDFPDSREVPAPLRRRVVVHVRFSHVGNRDHGAHLLSALRQAAAPLLDTVRTRPLATP